VHGFFGWLFGNPDPDAKSDNDPLEEYHKKLKADEARQDAWIADQKRKRDEELRKEIAAAEAGQAATKQQIKKEASARQAKEHQK
jgi:hypothetical protein